MFEFSIRLRKGINTKFYLPISREFKEVAYEKGKDIHEIG